MKRIRFFLLIFTVLSIINFSACLGGGGGDGGGGSTPPSGGGGGPAPANRAWGTAQLLETDNAGDAWAPRIAMDDSGNAYAVWSQFEKISQSINFGVGSFVYNIRANRYEPGAGWSGVEVIGNTDENSPLFPRGNAIDPQIVFDKFGYAAAIWSQAFWAGGPTPFYTIMANSYVPGTGWLGFVRADPTDMSDTEYYPQIAVDNDDRAFAVWKGGDYYGRIWGNEWSGGSWQLSGPIVPVSLGTSYFPPQLAISTSGTAIVVWEQEEASSNFTGIYANVLDYTGFFGGTGTITLISAPSIYTGAPRIVADASGNALVVWQQKTDTTTWRIIARTYEPATGWGNSNFLDNDTGAAQSPSIAMDSSGNAIAVWMQYDNNTFQQHIWAARYVPGTGWSGAERIEAYSASADWPDVGLDSQGNAIAAWAQFDGARWTIAANKYVLGSGWGTAQIIGSNDPAGYISSIIGRVPLQIAVDKSGNAIVVWNESDGTRVNIWANVYK